MLKAVDCIFVGKYLITLHNQHVVWQSKLAKAYVSLVLSSPKLNPEITSLSLSVP